MKMSVDNILPGCAFFFSVLTLLLGNVNDFRPIENLLQQSWELLPLTQPNSRKVGRRNDSTPPGGTAVLITSSSSFIWEHRQLQVIQIKSTCKMMMMFYAVDNCPWSPCHSCFRYVLDGYPLTKAQVMLMEQRNIIPVRIIELDTDARDCADRATDDRYSKNRWDLILFSAVTLLVRLLTCKKLCSNGCQYFPL